ncbi:hypothetical protein B0T24DRAFT_598621 [Lasiosphaeria ovina]|uniref:Uncharacterized protein n=1 Tax=Lasiosphaeria ovina TaxID=92902 RepID=A0AAE0MZH8_9PEZI|nr:hypothetical protein B0T24DRAFT_598621 [Lasiosphaeria ovina]
MFGAHRVSAFGLLVAFLLLLCSPSCNAALNAQVLMVSDTLPPPENGFNMDDPVRIVERTPDVEILERYKIFRRLDASIKLVLHKVHPEPFSALSFSLRYFEDAAGRGSWGKSARPLDPATNRFVYVIASAPLVWLGAPLSKDARVLVPRTSGGNPPTFMSALHVSTRANHSNAREPAEDVLRHDERLGNPKTNTLPSGEPVSSMLMEPAAGSICVIATATDFDAMLRVTLLETGVDMGFPMLGRIIAQRFKLLPGWRVGVRDVGAWIL